METAADITDDQPLLQRNGDIHAEHLFLRQLDTIIKAEQESLQGVREEATQATS
jgi:hypothetical protein